jgi:hypothetical protein
MKEKAEHPSILTAREKSDKTYLPAASLSAAGVAFMPRVWQKFRKFVGFV